MRFFDYSTDATPEFKNALATQVSRYEMADNGAAYTPPAAAVTLALLLTVQTILTNTQPDADKIYANAFSGSELAVTSLSVAIVLICKTGMTNIEKGIKRLISDGVTKRFFNTVPTFPDANSQQPAASAAEQPNELTRIVVQP